LAEYTAPVCVPISLATYTLPDAVSGESYSVLITLTGTLPYTLDSYIKPTWLLANIVGNKLIFSGTPSDSDIATIIGVSVTLSNPCGTITSEKTINITGAPCIPISIEGSSVLPLAYLGTPYNFAILLSGSLPYSVSPTLIPSWMDMVITDKYLVITGTPDTTGNSIAVQASLSNYCGSATLATTLDIASNRDLINENYTGDYGAVTDVCTFHATFSRTSEAQSDAEYAGHRIKATYHILVDNSSTLDVDVTFETTDINVSQIVDASAGGACGGATLITCTSIIIL
jgi:hypothetical protein